MIIGNALCDILNGITIDVDGKTINVKNTFGDQDALEKFIREFDYRSLEKFPLIFVVITKTTGVINVESDRTIVIMTNTNPEWLSRDRTANTFVKVIQPIYEKLIDIIQSNEDFRIIGERKTSIEYTDRPNYGVVNGEIGKAKSKESVVTDYIDARIVELTLNYNKC